MLQLRADVKLHNRPTCVQRILPEDGQ